MLTPPTPADEPTRLEALRRTCLLDTPSEERFDRLTRLACGHFGVPMALISLIDSDRQWFKSRQGLTQKETPRSISFCGHAILDADLMVVEDARSDPRFADNPLVTGSPNIRFYAACPLRTAAGRTLGTLCILDDRPRKFTSDDRAALRDLGKTVEAELLRAPPATSTPARGPWWRRGAWPSRASSSLLARITSRTGAGVAALVLAATVLLAGLEWLRQEALLERAGAEQALVERLGVLRGRLESSLNARLHLVQALAGYVRAGGGLDDVTFRRFASQVGRSLPNVRSLQLAPGGVVTHVWPLEGNEAAIGHDLFADPGRRQAAEAAIAARRLWVAGPLKLIQGGTALIGREPIFTATGQAPAREEFWGFATILIDLPELFASAQFVAEDGVYRFALRGKDSLGRDGAVFFGDPAVFAGNPTTAEITLPAGSWELAGVRMDLAARNLPPVDASLAMFAAASLAGLLAFLLLRVPDTLHGVIASATAALERSEARFRDAIEALPDGFVIFDADDRLVMSNENFRRIYARNREVALEGQTFEMMARHALEHGQYRTNTELEPEEFLQRKLAAHHDPGQPFEEQLDDGRWIRVVESRMRDGGIVGFRSDITELKLKQLELRKAKERAEDANRTKSEFLATVSHEVRTPLNGMLGMLDVLRQDEELASHQRLQAETAHESAQHLMGILNQILDLSKLESGKLELDLSNVALRAMVDRAVSLQVAACQRKGLQLDAEVSPAVPDRVLADELRIRQILHNLLGNAVKFTDRGRIDLRVDSGGRRNGRDVVEFTITDTGVGFKASDADRIFDKFTQAESGATRRHEGTGLGLAICRSLVQMMGGEIAAESKPDGGSVFRFHILVDTVLPESRPAQGSREAPLPAQLGWAPVRLLMVEDSPTNQMVVKFMLEGSGYEVHAVASGREAIDVIGEASYEMVLMDISMPEMDGIETTRRLRSLALSSQPPIIALTANAMAGDRERFLRAGMDDYLPKPVEKSQLLSKLHHWACKARGIEEPTRDVGRAAPAMLINDEAAA